MLRYPLTYEHNSIALNGHLNADGTVYEAGISNTILVDERRVTPAYRDLRDPYHLSIGGQLGRVHKGILTIRLRGRIEAPDASQVRSLGDKERALRAAFDPDLCYRDSPSTEGVYRLLFTEDTTDTTNWANGRIPAAYYCRPTAEPEVDEAVTDRAYRAFVLGLVAADPRMYGQTQQTLALTPGSPSGNVINRGTSKAGLKATIVLTAAGAANFTIARSGVSLVLDLSGIGAGAHTVVVYGETCAPYGVGRRITKDGTAAASLKTSGPSTWLDVPVGTTSFSISNTTSVTSCTLAWYHSWA